MRSITSQPTLWRVPAYWEPGLPSPTTTFTKPPGQQDRARTSITGIVGGLPRWYRRIAADVSSRPLPARNIALTTVSDRMRPMDRHSLSDRLDELAPLAEPIRRALYLHVAHSGDAVGRDAAAAALGISRALAAFHLDRLVEAGLLAAEYRRLTGRVGPGAGRPAKLYRRTHLQLDVTLPERREDVLAGLFATAL